jgi:hypothetical protein
MKLKIVDYIFLIVYIVILLLLLFLTPVTITGGTGDVEESTPIWDSILWLLLYAIGVPIIYILIRWYSYKKKKTA